MCEAAVSEGGEGSWKDGRILNGVTRLASAIVERAHVVDDDLATAPLVSHALDIAIDRP